MKCPISLLCLFKRQGSLGPSYYRRLAKTKKPFRNWLCKLVDISTSIPMQWLPRGIKYHTFNSIIIMRSFDLLIIQDYLYTPERGRVPANSYLEVRIRNLQRWLSERKGGRKGGGASRPVTRPDNPSANGIVVTGLSLCCA